MFEFARVILGGTGERAREAEREGVERKTECTSLPSLKRISWCDRRGAGERGSQGEKRGREKTKAQLLLLRMREKDQLSAPSVRQRSMISPTIRDASLIPSF